VCQLNLRGMDDALAVISASTDNIEIMDRVVHEQAERHGVEIAELSPEQWLEAFYENRKGSGRGSRQRAEPGDGRRAAAR